RSLGLNEPMIGYIGRLVKAKGLDLLMHALLKVQGEWSLLVLGSGPYKDSIESWAARHGLQDRVRVLLVKHDDVPRYLGAMDMLVAPSQTTPSWKEQFGRMVIEAFACGVPVIGSDSGEIPRVIDDAGIVVEGTVLSGKCLFALDADADAYLIASADKNLYLVPSNAKGVERNNLTTIDKTRTTCELILNKVAAELISDDPEIYLRSLDAGRVMQAADTLGAAQCMLDQAVAYAKQREQFKRVIASFQAVKHMCAEMAANLEPCRSMVWYAGHALDEVPEEARLIACHAKAHLSEVGKFVAKTATEVHGGMGFTDLVGLHYWFKRIGANRALLGAPELVRAEAAHIQGLA
ncbi:MAG: glycosyltransferase, partial [Proteobacteria bacterium]|nr:glycosyltransferase [Pseudomonadota bacterium]